MPTPSALTIGWTRQGYCVRVAGRGTMRESPALRAFALRVLDEPGRPTLDVDLTACEYLDSTFLGALMGLFRRFEQAGPSGRLAIAGPTEVLHRLLGPTRLDAILPLRAECPERLGEEVPIPPQALDSARSRPPCPGEPPSARRAGRRQRGRLRPDRGSDRPRARPQGRLAPRLTEPDGLLAVTWESAGSEKETARRTPPFHSVAKLRVAGGGAEAGGTPLVGSASDPQASALELPFGQSQPPKCPSP